MLCSRVIYLNVEIILALVDILKYICNLTTSIKTKKLEPNNSINVI